MKNRLLRLACAYLVLVTLPLWLSIASHGGADRPWPDELGAALAMMAYTAVLIEFILLGRRRWLSVWLGSDLVMQAHQFLARTATVFLLLHPFFYTLWSAAGVPAGGPPATLRISGSDWALTTGLLALGVLLVLVLLALTRHRSHMAYDRWRLWHGVLALSVLGLGLHHTLKAGLHAQAPALATYWWALSGLALLSWLEVYVWRPLQQQRQAYQVTRITPRANRIHELVLRPRGAHRMDFTPGQFVWLKIGQLAPHRDHPFSISSVPQDQGELRFLIKEAGDFTRQLPRIEPDTLAYVDGPYGHMRLPDTAGAIVLIAGGIGIAPLASLLAACAQAKDTRPVRLIYADRDPGQMVPVAELCQTANLPDYREVLIVEQPPPGWTGLSGRLDPVGLEQALADTAVAPWLDRACFLVCGPGPMMDVVDRVLCAHGVPLDRIQSEKFQYESSGDSPRNRQLRNAWLGLSGAMLVSAAVAASLFAWT